MFSCDYIYALRRPSGSIAQNFFAPTYFTARQTDVAQTFLAHVQYSNHSPNHDHVTPLSQLQRGHLYISPSRQIFNSFFFSLAFFGGPPHSPAVSFCTPPIAHRQKHTAHGSTEPQPLPRPPWAPTRHSGPHPRKRRPLRRHNLVPLADIIWNKF